MFQSLIQRWRLARLRRTGVELTAPRWLARPLDARRDFANKRPGTIRFGPGAWLEHGVVLHAYGGAIHAGRDVFIGPHSVVYGHGGVEIGDACLIASHCRILSSNHTLAPFGTDIRTLPDLLQPTRLGRDVWLGAGVTVLGGVTIGDGCVIGAGSVVTRDLPAGAICWGSPAEVRRFRDGAPTPAGNS